MAAPMPASESEAISVVFLPRLRGTLSFWRSCINGRERNIGATLIHKDQLLGWQWAYFCSPGGSLLLVALRGTQRFFLRVQPTRRMARLIVVRSTHMPCVLSQSWQWASSVLSGWAFSCATRPASRAAYFLEGRPGMALGESSPVSLRCFR